MAQPSRTDLCASRTLILSYLSNSVTHDIATYASKEFAALQASNELDEFDEVSSVGQHVSDEYDFSEDFIDQQRSKFEQAEELTWKSFEKIMDDVIQDLTHSHGLSVFLAIVESINVPANELDDLVDLAVWYAACRFASIAKESGWNSFLEQESTSVQETNLRNLPDLKIGESITISQFEVATSSMPNESIIFDKNLTPVNTQPPSELIDADKTPVQSYSDRIPTLEELEKGHSDYHQFDINPDHFRLQSANTDSESISEQSSCERLSASPVVVSPVGTETPVYIASQPESVDLDSNDSSLDASLINELIDSLKGEATRATEDEEEDEIAFNRSNTQQTIKGSMSSDPIGIKGKMQSSSEAEFSNSERSPFPNSILEEACARVKAQEEESVGGITLQSESKENLDADDEENAIPARREIPKLDFPEGFCDTPRPSPTNLLKKLAEDAKKKEEESIILPEPQLRKPNYFLLAGAAALSIAAIYLKTAR